VHIIVGGCGRLGAEIAERLSEDPDTDVVAIDTDPLAFDYLGSAFNGDTVVGDVTDRDVLEQAGVQRADGLIAVTRSDNANLMAVEIAKELFGVRKTVARLFNPDREESYRKMGVHYVSGTRLVAGAIMNEIHAGTFPAHLGFPDSDVEVVEMRVRRSGHGMTVADIEVRGDVRIAAIQRGVRVRLPRADERLQEGDLVAAAISRGAHRHLRDYVEHPFAERV
jgi:trk system potassium uptake protein TrkA